MQPTKCKQGGVTVKEKFIYINLKKSTTDMSKFVEQFFLHFT